MSVKELEFKCEECGYIHVIKFDEENDLIFEHGCHTLLILSSFTDVVFAGAFKMIAQGELRYIIEMCEHYLNSNAQTSRQYYERLRKRTFKELVKLQLKEFDCDA
jgi:hypothetical protein